MDRFRGLSRRLGSTDVLGFATPPYGRHHDYSAEERPTDCPHAIWQTFASFHQLAPSQNYNIAVVPKGRVLLRFDAHCYRGACRAALIMSTNSASVFPTTDARQSLK